MTTIKYFMLTTLMTFFILIKSNSQDHNILFKIDGIEYDSAVIAFQSVQNSDDEFEDIAIISNGELKYKFNKTGLHEGVIVPFKLIHKFEGGNKFDLPSSRIRFYINNGDFIKIEAVVIDGIVTYTANGNNLSKQIAESREFLAQSELFKDRIEFEYQFHKKNRSKWTKEEDNLYWEKRNENNRVYAAKSEEFILNHPEYEYSPRLILEINDKQKATTLYNKLTPEAKSSYFGQVVGNMINGWAITTPGVFFPNFSAKTLTDEDFNLNDHAGKYVLVDFWGSWCGPCISEIPQLKKLQLDFKNKLTIIGMVCNDTREKINEVVKRHNISWIQLFDNENAFPSKYGIKSFPTKVLIDANGVVVKAFHGTSEEMFVELEEVLK